MAERASPLPVRGITQLGSIEFLSTRTRGRTSDVTLPQVLGSLAFLLLLLAGLWSLGPRRALTSQGPSAFAPPDPNHVLGVRPALGPSLEIAARPIAPPTALEEEDADVPLIDLAALGPVLAGLPSIERAVPESSTLRDIAREYEVDAAVLAAYNRLSPAVADEAVGREALSLPSGVMESTGLKLHADPPPPETVTYVIGDGDTLLGIALRFGVNLDALAAANGLPSVDLIRAGDQLQVSMWARPAAAAPVSFAPALPLPVSVPEPAVARDQTTPALAATIAEEATPARPSAPVTYEVAPGDTVSVIAERFGVDTETIVGANSLGNADRIRVGDELTILPISGVMHTVREGQTLSGVAALYKVDLGPIIDFNYLDDADLITVGKELIIPGARPLPPAPPAPPTTEYRVTPGDTLSGIAARFGVSPAIIAQTSGLANPDRLSVGSRLLIPTGTARAQPQQQVVTRNLPMFTAGGTSADVPTSGAANTIASLAMRYLGTRYVFGGTSPSGFDCSGFVYYVMSQSGHPVSRGMWGQYSAGQHPSRANLQPGDIVFFQNTYMPGLSHNGIYLGGGQFINAVDERSGVKISNINDAYWSSRWFGATRVG